MISRLKNIMRFEQINEYYIRDNYTGRKYTITEAVNLLNLYEEVMREYKAK